jgi:hypothetical protein
MTSLARTVSVSVSLIVAMLLLGCGGVSNQQLVSPLKITTGSVPNGTTGMPYTQTVQTVGGVGPFTWTISAGSLPHNLSLSASRTNIATISGTPDAGVQDMIFTIKVTDSTSQSATQTYTVSVLLGTDNLSLLPPSLDFGAQLVGFQSAAHTETLRNTGPLLSINSVAITGVDASDFTASEQTCGSQLSSGASCDISLVFNPSVLGQRAAALTITHDNVGTPQSVSVNGVGLVSGPNATVSAVNVDFGSEIISNTSQAQYITLSNYGNTPLKVAAISATGQFAQANDCPPSLPSGASCTVAVTFTPNVAGSATGLLSLTDSAPGNPQTVILSGSGAAGRCASYGRQCSARQLCCPGLKCVFSGGSTRVGYSCR